MTNRERAEQICVESDAVTGYWLSLQKEIERALDEAEKRGAESRCDLGFNDGYVSGQKEMRERIDSVLEEN